MTLLEHHYISNALNFDLGHDFRALLDLLLYLYK